MRPKILFFIFLTALAACKHEEKELPEYEADPAIERLAAFDEKLGEPDPGDWLDAHFEPGQTFKEYLKAQPVTPTETKNRIYIQPIGEFSELENTLMISTAEYLEIFFNLRTAILPVLNDSIVPASARRKTRLGEQMKTGFIMNYLLAAIQEDGVVVMAITPEDLYPSANFNYVFGQASTKRRVGVTSFNRFKDGTLDSTNFSLCLSRLTKTSAHEIGHMFTCMHCIQAVCLMNGSNGLSESDSQPNRTCSQCLRKLHWNLRFDVKARLIKLTAFFEKYNLKDDHKLALRDLSAID